MNLDAVLDEAGRALGDAQRLYGAAPLAGEWASTGDLVQARGSLLRTQRRSQRFWHGAGGGAYTPAAGGGVRALDVVVGADGGTEQSFVAGASQAQQGRARIGGVIATTQSGVAAIAPSATTPAGQRALITHLQGQLSDAKEVLQASQLRGRQLAALVRGASAGYGRLAPAVPLNISSPNLSAGSALGTLPLGAGSLFANRVGRWRGTRSDRPPPLHLSAQGPGPERVRAAIRKALDIKGIRDPAARARWESGMMLVAQRESGFSSNATNLRDGNAANGDPSRGTWQFIGSTFRAYHEPGTPSDQTDDLAQACAFINYAQRHYHVHADGTNLAANIQQADPTRPPRGY